MNKSTSKQHDVEKILIELDILNSVHSITGIGYHAFTFTYESKEVYIIDYRSRFDIYINSKFLTQGKPDIEFVQWVLYYIKSH